jgi:hypothetical protein
LKVDVAGNAPAPALRQAVFCHVFDTEFHAEVRERLKLAPTFQFFFENFRDPRNVLHCPRPGSKVVNYRQERDNIFEAVIDVSAAAAI